MGKMVFIEPKSPNLHIFSQFTLPRLGSFILGTMMKQRGWEVEIIVEENQIIDFNYLKTCDLVGISTITPTAPRSYLIADRIRGMGIPVIMGGPHVTFMPDEAIRHADYVIRGEGENALMALIDAWESGSDLTLVPNLSYIRDGLIRHNPIQPVISELDRIPYPDLTLCKGKSKRIAGKRIIPVQTSRGCPYDCSFCSVTGMFGRKYRFRSAEHIIEELRQYNDSSNFIFFYDDHFTADPERARTLLKKMISEKFRFQWSTQVRADIAKDPELVKLMKQAGCHTLFIGFESVNPDSLKAMHKQQTVEEISQSIRIIQNHHIHIHGMFVYGFDQDDWQTVRETVKFAKKSRLTSTQFLILTPFPGSSFYHQIESQDRICFRDWGLYDAHHPVFKPSRISMPDLQWAQIFSHRRFYSRYESLKRFFRGKWIDLGLAFYARNLNRVWQKRNRTFLKALELMRQRHDATITVDYIQLIQLDEQR